MASVAEDGRGKTALSLGELSSEPSRGYPNWATSLGKTQALLIKREPGELRHLSTLRKRNRMRFPE